MGGSLQDGKRCEGLQCYGAFLPAAAISSTSRRAGGGRSCVSFPRNFLSLLTVCCAQLAMHVCVCWVWWLVQAEVGVGHACTAQKSPGNPLPTWVVASVRIWGRPGSDAVPLGLVVAGFGSCWYHRDVL